MSLAPQTRFTSISAQDTALLFSLLNPDQNDAIQLDQGILETI